MQTTVGQLLVNDALPEDLRDYSRTLDKKGLKKLLLEVAQKHPDRYRDVSQALSTIGWQAAYTTGGNSFGLQHLRRAPSAVQARTLLAKQLDQLLDDDNLDDDARERQIIQTLGTESQQQSKRIYDESLAEGNPLALQVLSGSRGNPMNLASLRGSDLLYTDHRDRVMPIPVLRSYSQGLKPLEYWAGAYGARKGVIDVKMATRDSGYLSKQLNQLAHRLLVTARDRDDEPENLLGLPVDTDDDENEGALLSKPVGGYGRNTVLTPRILDQLRKQGIKRILVRSPAVSGAPDGGIYARDAGVREFGNLPELGQNIGMAAAQALSEPLSQGALSSKHTGGVAGAANAAAVSGFDAIDQLFQVPKTFKGGAAHANLDGLVTSVKDAPAGGQYVMIEGEQHYVPAGAKLKVQRGQHVEAGDVISDGTPNPATIVQHKGVGEGRRYFINALRQSFRDANLGANRRNIELMARGLINHVRLTEEVGDFIPGDTVPYSMLESSWQPREGSLRRAPRDAVGKYLEKPYLHYSIGTKIRPSMLPDFEEFGVPEVETHDQPPPFEPEMVRGAANLQHDPDWMTRMFGSGLKGGLLKNVHHGATSDPSGTSFVPGLAASVDFGTTGKVITPKRDQAPAKPPALLSGGLLG
jgi:DNA-directed RNA polymerase subunit beta'